jgi:hypothetical protein
VREGRPYFATMPTDEFVAHLESHGIEPWDIEKKSLPLGHIAMESGIETSILNEGAQQRYGSSEQAFYSGK